MCNLRVSGVLLPGSAAMLIGKTDSPRNWVADERVIKSKSKLGHISNAKESQWSRATPKYTLLLQASVCLWLF